MRLNSLALSNFRSHSTGSFTFSPTTNLFLGPNGSGKTNLLDAIYFLSTGKSFLSHTSRQLVGWDKSHAIADGIVEPGPHQLTAQIILEGPQFSRRFLYDKNTIPRSKYLGQLVCVVFQPEDIRLVTGSPTRRRDFLDLLFAGFSWRYTQSLSQYHRSLRHRNALLDQIRQNQAQANELFFWDQSLIKNSQIIHQFRQQFIEFTNHFFATHSFAKIQSLHLAYRPSPISADLLSAKLAIDTARGHTSLGPHLDDFVLEQKDIPETDQSLASWGSRGQQRLAVLALRLAQTEFLVREIKDHPVLLLDDVFSELDDQYRHLVVNLTKQTQTFFTSADPDTLSLLPDTQTIRL